MKWIAVIILMMVPISCGGSRVAVANRYAEFSSENPPCKSPPISVDEVIGVAKKALRGDFSPKGMAEPNRRVREFKCVYLYEQSAIYFNGIPASLDVPDATYKIYISRDGRYIR